MFQNNCTIAFTHNEASQGGAILTQYNIAFKENSIVQFASNKATLVLEGALHISNITLKENTAIRFEYNEALLSGGALYCDNSNIMF